MVIVSCSRHLSPMKPPSPKQTMQRFLGAYRRPPFSQALHQAASRHPECCDQGGGRNRRVATLHPASLTGDAAKTANNFCVGLLFVNRAPELPAPGCRRLTTARLPRLSSAARESVLSLSLSTRRSARADLS